MTGLPPVVITRVLRPKRRPDLLRRQRLLDFLHEHVDRKLILVSAAAGYGKTSLLIDFSNDIDLPVCWYTVADTDRDMRIFVEYLIASIRQQFPTFGERTAAFLSTAGGGPLDPGTVANLLVNDIYQDIPDYFILVVDDFYRGEDEGTNFLLDTLLQQLPENCHIILASRSIPRLTPKGMALLIARREVEGLGTNDLRFDANEIRALLAQNHKQHIPPEQAEILSREAEGWITGILLTTHNMWKGLFASIIEAKGAGSQIYEYLANEVFNQQPLDIQQFLRDTSVLEEMTPSLCNRLLDRRDSSQMLVRLEELNLFISHVERDKDVWYRYHNLFQQFLLAKAKEAGRLEALHARAGELLEGDGDLVPAIAHYQAAHLPQAAARVIARAAPTEFERNHWRTLAEWIDALPEEVQETHPRLLWYRASIHADLGEIDRAIPVFNRAEAAFRQQGDDVGVADVLINRSSSLRIIGRFADAEAHCRQALSLLAQAEPSHSLLRSAAEAHRLIGICLMQQGNLSEGTDELRRSLALYEQAQDRYGSARLHSDLGTALRVVGNLPASDIHFDQALTLWQELGASAWLANTLNNIGLGHHLRGQYGKAIEVYERALTIAQETALGRMQAVLLAGMGDVYRDLGQVDQAFAAYNEARPLAERAQDAPLVSYILDALGNTYILTGDFVRANELIRQAYEQAQERKSRQAAALFLASLGVLQYERGDPAQAITHLQESVSVLQEMGARRDLPKVRLHLANAYYLNGWWDRALEALDAALDDVFALGYDQFLEPIGRRMLPFFRFATRHRPGHDHLADLARRIMEGQPTSAPETPPVAVATATDVKLRIYGFGEARVLRGDKPIDQRTWATNKAKELLFYLLTHPYQRRDQIGANFWPDYSSSRMRSAFHITLFRLRRALGVPNAILFEDDRYSLNPQIEFWYDVQEFERLLAQADRVREQDAAAYEAYLREAVGLYRGDFLESLNLSVGEWHTALAERLRQKYIQSLLTLARVASQRAEYEAALNYYQRVTHKDSYIEAAHRGIMETYRHLGDRSAAVRHYRDLESYLQRELGVTPEPETQHLYEEIIQGD